jgi:outer membrane murein-binding lipoprotein Lpp
MAMKPMLLAGAAIAAVLTFSAGSVYAQVDSTHTPQRSTLEQQVESLTAAVHDLDARLDAETRARQAIEAQAHAANAEATAARADAEAARAQLAARVQPMPTVAETASAARPNEVPGLHDRGVTLSLGGFLAVESIYRSRNDASDISSSFNRIAFDNSPLAHTSELRGTARQSRLSALVEADLSATMHGALYGEIDFQGGAQTANSIESNSYNPRLRHLYGTVDWSDLGLQVLAGQTWSLVTLNGRGITPRNETPPGLIDGQYLPGFAWARQPQLRLAKDWNRTIWAAVSLENPQTTFAGAATGISSTANGISVVTTTGAISGFDSGNNLSLNQWPDMVAKLAYEPQIGDGRPLHLEVFGLWRNFQTRVNVGAGNALGLPEATFNSTAQGSAVGASAGASMFSGRLDLQASVMTGQGIGRYGSAQLPDVTLRSDGSIAPIGETMVLLGATWHATPALDLYIFGGEERQQRRFFDDATGHYGFGNPAATFTEANCSTEGGVCVPNLRSVSEITLGFWRKAYTGPYGQIRFGVQYAHTRLSAFAGADGFAPETSDDMVFASIRYYPQ